MLAYSGFQPLRVSRGRNRDGYLRFSGSPPAPPFLCSFCSCKERICTGTRLAVASSLDTYYTFSTVPISVDTLVSKQTPYSFRFLNQLHTNMNGMTLITVIISLNLHYHVSLSYMPSKIYQCAIIIFFLL